MFGLHQGHVRVIFTPSGQRGWGIKGGGVIETESGGERQRGRDRERVRVKKGENERAR